MSQVAISGNASGTGTLTIASPNTNSNYTLTLPTQTGTVMANGPAFSAYVGSAQSIISATFVKMQVNTEEFDTNSNFDSTTNYRFTPTVAGYYQVNGNIVFSTNITSPQLAIYKNGTNFKVGTNYASGAWANVSALVYLNGSTDYIELYGAHVTGTTQSLNIASNYNYFQASMVRGA